MSNGNGRAMADITQAAWESHLELEGKILGQYSRLEAATRALVNETGRLTTAVDKLERRLNKTERRTDSLVDEAEVEDKAAAIISRRARVFRTWSGWAVAVAAGIWELFKLWSH